MPHRRWLAFAGACLVLLLIGRPVASAGEANAGKAARDRAMLRQLDAPVLFVKRFNQQGIHIYDNFFKWRPGGGLFVLENPADPPAKHRIRPLVGPEAPGTLGNGMYWDPDISYDGTRLLFCFKGDGRGATSIYEIGVDGKGLRRVTDPTPFCGDYKGSHAGVHDMQPAYLPDGRILFTSTRQHGLVPCANEGVNILHVMNADGSGIRAISVNNVNEFDPCLLPDGRVLHGRWEYVDKTALTIQSLWTIFPDGTNETALFANNMVHPEALLDARPLPDTPHVIVASFTPHNSPPRGSIGLVDMRRGKNGTQALINLEHPTKPDHDRGNSCEPWPLSDDVILYSGMPRGHKLNAIMMIDRSGHRVAVTADPRIDCHDPMPVKPRPLAAAIVENVKTDQRTGTFYVQDLYDGLVGRGVERGEVKWLRVIEETSRVSASPGGAMNQTFLMSGVLAWSAKNYLGVVPVEPDGSAYFEAPAGRALYLQAIDGEGRIVQSMRTFVQAAPGITRSCIGCHEHKYSSPAIVADRMALKRLPSKLQSESWGSGFIDFPSMVQPVFDKHCVRCHGGERGFAGKLDLSGGWTEYFTISYENLISRHDTQVTASLIAGIDCMNGTSLWSAQIMPPRTHGSGAAPLAKELVSGHKGRIPKLTRAERDLVLAWIDTNGLFHGTWDYTKHGPKLKSWAGTRNALAGGMQAAGCMKCHKHFEADWLNLRQPEHSRILRAPLAKSEDGHGQALCRDRKVDPREQRVRVLLGGAYHHAVRPVASFRVPEAPQPEGKAAPVVTFASTHDPHYQAMLAIIRGGRRQALAVPRVDMPGAEVIPGEHRQPFPPPIPEPLPELRAEVDADSIVRLSWERSARTIGLAAEVHRGEAPGFKPGEKTLLAATPLFAVADADAPQGQQHYALVLCSTEARSAPVRTTVTVPPPQPPPAPGGLKAASSPGRVELRWQEPESNSVRYHVYRARAGAEDFQRLTAEPSPELRYVDASAPEGVKHAYAVRAVNRRGGESASCEPVVAASLPEVKEPMFVAAFAKDLQATLYGGGAAPGKAHGKARVSDGALDLRGGGFVTFPHRPDFDLSGRISVELWVHFTKEAQMPVVVSCGHWNQAGWFLQRIGGGWRWHVGGIDCDGGKPAVGRWTHLVCTYDGQTCRLFQDGKQVAEQRGAAIQAPWRRPLHVGQYSGGPGPQYQVLGWVAGLKVYGRALPAGDAQAAAHKPPAPRKP